MFNLYSVNKRYKTKLCKRREKNLGKEAEGERRTKSSPVPLGAESDSTDALSPVQEQALEFRNDLVTAEKTC